MGRRDARRIRHANPGQEIGGGLWRIVVWAKKRPWLSSVLGTALSAIVASVGFGKDPRNGLVYVYKPVISAIQDSVKASEDRQLVAVSNLADVLQEMKDYDSAQARVDRRRAEEAARRLKKDKVMNRPALTQKSQLPFDPKQGFTARDLSGHGAMFGGTN